MFLVASLAAAGAVNLGWPCSRMNWAWRNVWSTCSINSYIAGPLGDFAPAHWRKSPLASGNTDAYSSPSSVLDANGVYVPNAGSGQVPQMICAAMGGTRGVGTSTDHEQLRSRCRRAIDAYAGIVHVCKTPSLNQRATGSALATGFPDFAPATAHVPHTENVNNLQFTAQRCWTPNSQARSPSTTCPGLLGWFSVVWNACGFATFGPTAAAGAAAKELPKYETIGAGSFYNNAAVITPLFTQATSGTAGHSPSFIFCSPKADGELNGVPTAQTPTSWNVRGPNFRTTRCRKALDQFGRTATRCGGMTFPSVNYGATDAFYGLKDQIRNIAIGKAAGDAPMGLLHLAPLCNQ